MTAIAVTTRYVYDFDDAAPGGRTQLDGKGLGLAEMTHMGLPVPRGFTVTSDACRAFMNQGVFPEGLDVELVDAVRRLETATGKRFGDPVDPLLVSVRSGAAISMPGMMDSILDLGLSDAAADALARGGDEHFAFDSYRRLIQMFGEVVDGIDGARFEHALSALKQHQEARSDTDLSTADLRQLVTTFKQIYFETLGRQFPQDPHEQLRRAIQAVFRSWLNPRAQVYRHLNSIPDSLGTAANVVEMVFGNAGEQSATGGSIDRRTSSHGRVPSRRAGRGRGCRHSRSAASRRPAGDPPGGLRRVCGCCRAP